MLLQVLPQDPLVRGIIFGLLGVGFWVGGLLAANYLWKHFRGE